MLAYIYILGTIIFTIYSQIILKWRIVKYGHLPTESYAKLMFLLKLFFDPFIFSGFVSAFLASLCWMAAMTKFEISYAYPFMSAAFIGVLILSVLLFNEPLTIHKILGLLLISLGIFISSQSA
jgi:multidrug transporter EmrE-like cation transporter